MKRLKLKQISIVYIVIIVTVVVLFFLRNTISEHIQSKDASQSENVSEGTTVEVPISELESNQKDLGVDLSKIKEEAVLSLKKRTAGREIDKDVTPIYTANYMIKYLYSDSKARSFYANKTESEDDAVIMKAISNDVANYLNNEMLK